ncbi:hypothetical protein CVN76_14640 [Bacillus sp. mrc49]|nr:hypothetical protein CVN76_14640 [Bacillus sp. mrc49]
MKGKCETKAVARPTHNGMKPILFHIHTFSRLGNVKEYKDGVTVKKIPNTDSAVLTLKTG